MAYDATKPADASPMVASEIRTNQAVLKTNINDDGTLKILTTSAVSSAGNTGAGEDDLTGYTKTITGGRWANGDSLWIRACGTLAQNTNAKTLRLDVGGQKVVLINAYATSVATNRWVLDITVTRMTSTTARLMGWITYGVTTGATGPTEAHFTSSITGLTWANDTAIKLTAEATNDNDITAEAGIFTEVMN